MNISRPELGTLPPRIARLPIDDRGYPVPWFVAWIDGAPEFRAMDGAKFAEAVRGRRCWVCGDRLGAYLAFVIGPMCAVNRVTSEPPCHHDCAVWAAQHCPFLTRPHMRRRLDGLDAAFAAGAEEGAGCPIDRNPGATCVWTTRTYRVFKPDRGNAGYLIAIGDSVRVEWFTEGRAATRAEVEAAIDSGLPSLLETVEREAPADRPAARAAILQARAGLAPLFPAA